MSDTTDFTPQERANLALAAPELADGGAYGVMTKAELLHLARRYPTDDRIKALVAGKPTQGALNEAAAEDPAADAVARRRYPSMFKP